MNAVNEVLYLTFKLNPKPDLDLAAIFSANIEKSPLACTIISRRGAERVKNNFFLCALRASARTNK